MPAQIIYHPDGLWQSVVDGTTADPHHDPAIASGVADIWHGGTIIDGPEYSWRLEIKEWARTNNPDHPSLHPRKPINPMLIDPVIPIKRTPR